MEFCMKIVVLWLYGYCCHGGSAEIYRDVRPKIIDGGEHIDFNTEYTFTVFMDYYPNIRFCTGSVLQEEWVMTSAHYFDNRTLPSQLYVGYQIYKYYLRIPAESIFKHPLYNPDTLENDVALIRLSEFLNTTSGNFQRTPVELFSGNLDELRESGDNCFLTAYGRQNPLDEPYRVNGFVKLNVSLEDESTCNETDNFNNTLHFCYKGKPHGGACKGDEGAPVLCDIEGVVTQVGINLVRNCDNGSMLATDVSSVNDWISETMLKHSYPRCRQFPRVRKGRFSKVNMTTWMLNCNAGFEPTPTFPLLTCLRADNKSLEGRWSSTDMTCGKRYKCDTFGQTFMVAFIYEDNWSNRFPALSILIDEFTEVNIQIPLLDFNGFYLLDRSVSFIFSKAIYGLNETVTQLLGISISASKPVKVLMYQHEAFGIFGEGSVVLPEKCASKRYTLFLEQYRFSQAVVVALSNDTTVTAIGEDNEVHYTRTLNRFEGFRPGGFGNSYVFSDADIVAFTGHECGEAPYFDPEYCGYLMEQILPDPSLGQTYIVPNFRPVKFFTIVVIFPYPYTLNEFIYWSTASPNDVYQANSRYIFNTVQYTDEVVQCSRPCMVYVVSNDRSTASRDFYYAPFNIAMTPVDQFDNNYNFVASLDGGFVTVTIDHKFGTSGLRLNDSPLSEYLSTTVDYISTAVIPDVGTFTSLKFHVNPGNIRLTHERRRATFGVLYYGFNDENNLAYAFQYGRKI